jgi:hypothetical protein
MLQQLCWPTIYALYGTPALLANNIRPLWNPKFHCDIYKVPSKIPLAEINESSTNLASYLLIIHFNVILHPRLDLFLT